MAMTGGTAVLVSSATPPSWKDPICLYVYWKESSQNVVDNTTTLSLGVYVSTPKGWDIGPWGHYYPPSYVGTELSGDNYKEFNGGIPNFQGTRWLTENQNVTVKHNADGTMKATIYYRWGVFSGWTGVMKQPTGSFEVDLTPIDRAPPVVSFSVSNITTNSMKISATSNAECEEWYYSLDNGATWTSYSTEKGTSASVTVNDLKVNTVYPIKVHARRTYNKVPGISSTTSVKTLGQAFINSCDDFYADEETVTITPNVTVYEAAFDEHLIVKNGSTALFTIGPFDWKAGTENRTITLNSNQKQRLLKEMSQATLTLTLVVDSYSGSTFVGSSTPVTVNAKTSAENSKPDWKAPYLSWEDTSDCVNVTGNSSVMIQGYSNLVVTAIGVTAKNYATIASYSVTIGNKTVKSSSPVVDVGTIDSYGNLAMRLTVTDSRGHSHDLIRTVTVLKYEAPAVDSITLRRANGIDDVIQLSFSASMSTIKPDGNADKNALTVAEYYYRVTNEEDYGSAIRITDRVVRSSTGTSLSFETNQLTSLDNTCSYDFVLHIADRVTNQWTHYVIPKGIPAVAIRKDKVGINTPDPKFALDVSGDVNFTGSLKRNGVDFLYPVGSIYLSVKDTDPGTVFGGTWERLQDRFLLGASNTYKAGSTGGEAAHTLTEAEMPSHTHSLTLKDTDRSSGNPYTQVNWAYSNDTTSGSAITDSSGSGQAHNNMPPYLAVYMWVRKS